MSKLKKIYEEMQDAYLGGKAALVPRKYRSIFINVGSASDIHYRFKRLIPEDKKKVLIVGPHGGRDYFYFKTAGYDVQGIDLFSNPDFGDVIVGNIEDIDLPEKSFDVVIASAVIEHVANDFKALRNIRRMLKDDGLFFLALPLYNDWETTHLHIYSRETIKRMVETVGFSIEERLMYPNLFFSPLRLFNKIHHALNIAIFSLCGKTTYRYTLPPLWKLEFSLSKCIGPFARALRTVLGKLYNGTEYQAMCRKDETRDYLEHNKTRFEPGKPQEI